MYKSRVVFVILPAFNEEASIDSVLASIPEFVDKVIVVDDGSTDNTGDIARSRNIEVIRHAETKGVGLAFRSGIGKALSYEFDLLVNLDADGQFDAADIPKLIDPIIEGNYDFVTASRFKDQTLIPKMPRMKYWGNILVAKLLSSIMRRKFYDVSCGYRAYTRDILMRVNLFGRFTYTHESILDFAFKDASMLEVPLAIRGEREFGDSKVASNLVRYGYQTFKIIIRSFRDYRPLQFFVFLATIMLLVGFSFWIPLFFYYLETHSFSPYKWAGFTGAFFITCAILFTGLGFILDMFARMRLNQDMMMYEIRKMRQNQNTLR